MHYEIPESHYVYEFSYPEGMLELAGIVFYVGKGTNASRLDSHFNEAANGCDCEKCKAIRSVWDADLVVVRRIVFESRINDETLIEERRRILQHQSPHLTNIRLTNRKSITTSQGMFSIDLEEAIELEEVNEKWEDNYYPEDYAGDHHYLNEEWETYLRRNKKYRAGEGDVKTLLCCFYLACMFNSPSDRVGRLIDLWYDHKLQEV